VRHRHDDPPAQTALRERAVDRSDVTSAWRNDIKEMRHYALTDVVGAAR